MAAVQCTVREAVTAGDAWRRGPLRLPRTPHAAVRARRRTLRW
ncbi:MAG: hypothetical protein NZ898_13230 [Myxococcota bacterium]|nr:hypothetical protein [Myxococcota bacterium]MDW8363730.1 hypothetical protein [Myxococcales bacterium]